MQEEVVVDRQAFDYHFVVIAATVIVVVVDRQHQRVVSLGVRKDNSTGINRDVYRGIIRELIRIVGRGVESVGNTIAVGIANYSQFIRSEVSDQQFIVWHQCQGICIEQSVVANSNQGSRLGGVEPVGVWIANEQHNAG